MEIRNFKGLRNTTSPERFKPQDLAVAYDIELDDTGRILSRQGQTLKNPAALHSLFASNAAAIVMEGSTLKAVERDFSLTTIATLSNSNRLSADTYNDTIYLSNGTDTGRLVGRTFREWGVVPPTDQPAASVTTGALPTGRYLYALTYLRADGYESGTGISGVIDLAVAGGIHFYNIPVSSNEEVTDKVLYISSTNGEQMFKAAIIDNSVTNADYRGTGLDFTIPLTTQFAQQPHLFGRITDVYIL